MKKFVHLVQLLLMLGLGAAPLKAQELNCKVETDLIRLSSEARNRLKFFKDAVESYMNNYRWTNEEFNDEDRIECTMQFVFTSADLGKTPAIYSAQVFIGSTRPVYNSLQRTSVLRILDQQVEFEFDERQGILQHNDLVFDALGSFLSFYAYMILGYDFDSFTKYGGTLYFEQALRLVRLAQTQSEFSKGWNQGDGSGRNRSVFIDEMLDPRYERAREAVFNYHFNGIDLVFNDQQKALNVIKKSVEKLAEVDKRYPGSNMVRRFFDAKYLEITRLLKSIDAGKKQSVYQTLLEVDPTHRQTYDQIISPN
jgi:hypothetical protein